MGARRKPQGSRKPVVVDTSMRGMRRDARIEAHDGALPIPSMTVAAPGTSRKNNDKKRHTKAGHGKHK